MRPEDVYRISDRVEPAMPYVRLRPAPATPPNLKDYIRIFVDMQFADVHAMLRLPLPIDGLDAGCNFSGASWTFALLNGTARMFVGDAFDRSGDAFDGLLQRFYPWTEEPPGTLTQVETVKYLRQIRDLLAHSLGVMLKRRTERGQVVIGPVAPDLPFGVTIAKTTLSEEQIEELEKASSRPAWLGPTLRLEGDTLVMLVPALYRAARLTLERVTEEPTCHEHAQRLFQKFVGIVEGTVTSAAKRTADNASPKGSGQLGQ
jgi:hypothetical protein